MPRIPLVDVENLPPDQLAAFNASGLDLFRLMAQGKTVVMPFISLSHAIFAKLDIPPVERELIVLAVLHLERGEYEWAQHLAIAREMGIAEEKIQAIGEERFGAKIFDEREKALLAFTRQVVRSVRVDDYVFNAAAAFYSPRQLVEAIYTIGSYMTVVRLSEVAELELDAVKGPELLRSVVADR